MKPIRLITVVSLIVMLAGCRFSPGLLVEQNQTEAHPNRIEDPQLAKLILTPKREKLKVARDPFQPLLTKSGTTVTTLAAETDLKIKYLGALKVSDQTKALLRVNDKKRFYLKDEVIQGYTIESIDMDQVTLIQGERKLKIKRSEDK